MGNERIFRFLLRMGQRLPARLRIALTRSPSTAWLRRLSQLPRGGSAVVPLSGALADYRMLLEMRAGHSRYALRTYDPATAALMQSTLRGQFSILAPT